ncbi:MAG: substrate-binding domain-containing protein [Salinisphaera sp.]|jgi:simple sugar transport system substrate-binding protein|nr:substrate-binding domain-containing protein [Salinisphaera sp.]
MFRKNGFLKLVTIALMATGLFAVAGSSLAATDNANGNLKFAMITHANPGDTFWDIEHQGGEQAAKDLGVKFFYVNDNEAPKQANDVENAIQQNVAGIALTLAHPSAMEGPIKDAADAGIPVVGFNSGLGAWKTNKKINKYMKTFIGQSGEVAGEAFGRRLNELHAKHVLYVSQEQGNVELNARGEGIKSTFKGKYTELYVNGQSMPDVRSGVISKLQADPSIDYVAFGGAPYAMNVVRAMSQIGRHVTITTFDLDASAIKAIQDGKIKFAVDQQPFLQGYLAIVALYLKATNDNTIGGGKPVYTGPSFVTKDNVNQLAKYAKRGTRG